MSKRFGRNQRRRMREQVENLTSANAMTTGLLRDRSERVRRLEDEIAQAKRTLGSYFVGFDPQVMEFGQKTDRVFMQERSLPDLAAWSEQSEPAVQYQLRSMPLDVLASRVDERAVDGARHIYVHFRDHRWGYAISESALAKVPTIDLARHISLVLGRQIASDLKAA